MATNTKALFAFFSLFTEVHKQMSRYSSSTGFKFDYLRFISIARRDPSWGLLLVPRRFDIGLIWKVSSSPGQGWANSFVINLFICAKTERKPKTSRETQIFNAMAHLDLGCLVAGCLLMGECSPSSSFFSCPQQNASLVFALPT